MSHSRHLQAARIPCCHMPALNHKTSYTALGNHLEHMVIIRPCHEIVRQLDLSSRLMLLTQWGWNVVRGIEGTEV